MLWFLFAYIVGAIPCGFIIAKLYDVDICKEGSGSIGATNVLRILGKKLGILCFLLDFLKGFVFLYFFYNYYAESNIQNIFMSFTLLVGHSNSIFLRFKGGKGIATGAGCVAVLTPKLLLTCLIIWYILFRKYRIVSLASVITVICLPILSYIYQLIHFEYGIDYIFFYVFLSFFMLFTHQENVKRLLKGKELKIADRK